ncbi:MAG TPA: L-seryl-tRNA(Sec) selenium transferase [Phycisphaerae bacterium]|nr:L-seryl-tRNA(Sec) selenium transferase [Phycisphaerae bacterium]
MTRNEKQNKRRRPVEAASRLVRKAAGARGTASGSNRASKVGTTLLSAIPSMTVLLGAASRREPLARHPRAVLTQGLRDVLADLRRRVTRGKAEAAACDVAALLRVAEERLRKRGGGRLVRAINATGIVLHTGLGRSVLPQAAIERISQVAGGYCNLEIDMESGERGVRGGYVEQLLGELTGAPAALVVNNNAAATMLALRALAGGREVIVSRGQLIEIGGSYRLPEVMAAGGAVLREVGTTNKTHLRDYARAIGERTGLIMHVHTSNYRVVGFAQTPAVAELAQLAREQRVPLLDDLGSGALLENALWTAANEPTVVGSLRAGADLICFSGDKLLGGPQAGILLGKRKIIERLRSDPMARALRVGKLTMAALEAVLELYHEPDRARREIPLLAQLGESVESLIRRADFLASLLREAAPGESFSVQADESFAGGGSLPAWPLPTATVRWKPQSGGAAEISEALRKGNPPVLARVSRGNVNFDLRTIAEDEIDDLVRCVVRALPSPLGRG